MKMHLKMLSDKLRSFCLDLNVLTLKYHPKPLITGPCSWPDHYAHMHLERTKASAPCTLFNTIQPLMFILLTLEGKSHQTCINAFMQIQWWTQPWGTFPLFHDVETSDQHLLLQFISMTHISYLKQRQHNILKWIFNMHTTSIISSTS